MDYQITILIITSLTLFFLLLVFILFIFNAKNEKYFKSEQDKKEDNFYSVLNSFENNIISNANKIYNDMLKVSYDNSKNLNQDINKSLNDLRDTYDKKLIDLINTNESKLSQMITANENKLSILQQGINERLDVSLNERLNQSFQTIDNNLSNLNNALSDIKKLSSGVSDLQKILSNVKTGGNFGEAQLDIILGDMLTRDQYECQFSVKADSREKVDFAIKLPDKTTESGIIYLPIDSKFSIGRYNDYLTAKAEQDDNKILITKKLFKDTLDNQAKSISDKYINPPITTDFALMFLPSEGLYAECVCMEDLVDNIRKKYNVVIVSPTTICAIIKSFAIGFRYMKISDSAQKINNILQSIKKQYELFEKDISTLKNSLTTATKRTDDIEKRTIAINKKLSNITDNTIDTKDNDEL